MCIIHIICFYLQNGYVFKLHQLAPCGTNNVMEFKNAKVVIDKDCNIVPQACLVTSGFKSAMVTLCTSIIYYTLTVISY